MHDKLLLFSKFLISPRLTESESRAICRGAFAPKKFKKEKRKNFGHSDFFPLKFYPRPTYIFFGKSIKSFKIVFEIK